MISTKLYLANIIGTGTLDDMFRPDVPADTYWKRLTQGDGMVVEVSGNDSIHAKMKAKCQIATAEDVVIMISASVKPIEKPVAKLENIR